MLPVGEHEALRRALPNAQLVDADALLTRLKLVKEDEEIQAARLTAEIADEGVLAAQRAIGRGVSDSEVGAAIRAAQAARAIDRVAACSGLHAGLWHGHGVASTMTPR